jgi:hypothetical protein
MAKKMNVLITTFRGVKLSIFELSIIFPHYLILLPTLIINEPKVKVYKKFKHAKFKTENLC